jgi:hypothetical protein
MPPFSFLFVETLIQRNNKSVFRYNGTRLQDAGTPLLSEIGAGYSKRPVASTTMLLQCSAIAVLATCPQTQRRVTERANFFCHTNRRSGLLTDPIFLDRIPDPDPFPKSYRIPHSDPLVLSGSAIRSDLPIYKAVHIRGIFFFSYNSAC